MYTFAYTVIFQDADTTMSGLIQTDLMTFISLVFYPCNI